MAKLFVVFIVCVVVATTVQSKASKEDEDSGGETLMKIERCDDNMCGSVERCHECCQHNFHLDYESAKGDIEKEHAAIDKMCSCFHKVNGHEHQHKQEGNSV